MSKSNRTLKGSCELAELAAEFERTVQELNDLPPKTSNFDEKYNHISDRLLTLNGQASHLTPSSPAGCLFLVMLINGDIDRMVNGSGSFIRDTAARRVERMLYAIASCLGSDAPPLEQCRTWLMTRQSSAAA